MAFNLLLGYDTSFGNKKAAVADIPGPVYYRTGGAQMTLASLGLNWGGLDAVLAGVSQSGTYIAYARFEKNGADTFIDLFVVTAHTGAEVAYAVNLSAEQFRMVFIGE